MTQHGERMSLLYALVRKLGFPTKLLGEEFEGMRDRLERTMRNAMLMDGVRGAQ